MSKRHDHYWAIIAHSIEAKGKDFRALLGCQLMGCPAYEIIRPKQNRKHDEEFWDRIDKLPHRCCERVALPALPVAA